jgi:hypothetical protein
MMFRVSFCHSGRVSDGFCCLTLQLTSLRLIESTRPSYRISWSASRLCAVHSLVPRLGSSRSLSPDVDRLMHPNNPKLPTPVARSRWFLHVVLTGQIFEYVRMSKMRSGDIV